MSDDKTEKKARTPGRKILKEDLLSVMGGSALQRGCGTQGCAVRPEPDQGNNS